jgi:hypothetical protein
VDARLADHRVRIARILEISALPEINHAHMDIQSCHPARWQLVLVTIKEHFIIFATAITRRLLIGIVIIHWILPPRLPEILLIMDPYPAIVGVLRMALGH